MLNVEHCNYNWKLASGLFQIQVSVKLDSYPIFSLHEDVVIETGDNTSVGFVVGL